MVGWLTTDGSGVAQTMTATVGPALRGTARAPWPIARRLSVLMPCCMVGSTSASLGKAPSPAQWRCPIVRAECRTIFQRNNVNKRFKILVCAIGMIIHLLAPCGLTAIAETWERAGPPRPAPTKIRGKTRFFSWVFWRAGVSGNMGNGHFSGGKL